MENTKFYICPHCGNIVEMVHDAGVKPFCCGQKMNELVPNTVEASGENVGSVDHPMVDVHWIEWVQLVTEKGSQRKHLTPGETPHVKFWLGDDKAVAVYAYCNLHGLWKTELN